jgi:predicted HNH restriction endonuclease
MNITQRELTKLHNEECDFIVHVKSIDSYLKSDAKHDWQIIATTEIMKQETKKLAKAYSLKLRKLIKNEDDPIKFIEHRVLQRSLTMKGISKQQKGAVKI